MESWLINDHKIKILQDHTDPGGETGGKSTYFNSPSIPDR